MATKQSTTQDFIPIQEIRDGIVILKSGGMRSIILCTSLNFALKSADEQSSILMQFQNFLNSLDFSIQIFAQSKKLDIRPYIALLEDRYKEQTTELMKIQVREYIEFIKSFVESTSIMSKSFFVVVPYDPAIMSASKNPLIERLAWQEEQEGSPAAKASADQSFAEYRSQLEQRVAVVEQGLVRCGITRGRAGHGRGGRTFLQALQPGRNGKADTDNVKIGVGS